MEITYKSEAVMVVSRILRTVGAWCLFETCSSLIPCLTFAYFFQFSPALKSWQFYGYIQGVIHEGRNSRWHWDTPAATASSLAASPISCGVTTAWLFTWMTLKCYCGSDQKIIIIIFWKHLPPWSHDVENLLQNIFMVKFFKKSVN